MVKFDINLRLDKWLGLQKEMPKNIIARTSFKPSARGSSNHSFLLVKTNNLGASEQLDLLFELVKNLKQLNLIEKIA